MVEVKFAAHFGDLRPFGFPTDEAQAQESLEHFLTHHLATFGDYQDAMLQEDKFLHHSILSVAINIGLLDPLYVCKRVEAEYHAGKVAINSAEGFIRQIIGWREYVREIYALEGRDYTQRNALNHTRPLPSFYWGGANTYELRRACGWTNKDRCVCSPHPTPYGHGQFWPSGGC